MIWRCTLLLALCAFSCVRSMSYPNRIEYRYGAGPSNYPCTPECYAMIRQWFMQQGCNLPYGMGYGSGGYGSGGYGTGGYGSGGYGTGGYGSGGSGTGYPGNTGSNGNPYGQDVYIDYYNNYGQIESLKVSGPCFAFQLCDKCGPNGQCVVETYSQPECKCKEGYEGDKCDEKIPDGQNNVIIAVTVIAGLLAFFILVAVIVHMCWKHKGNNQWRKPNHVHVNPGHHCQPMANHCGPSPLRIHAATPMHGMGHQHCYPPVVGGPYCPPRSTVKITEIVEDSPYAHRGAVVPAGGGLFGNGGVPHQATAPIAYTTIGAAPAGHGTTITL